MRGRDRGRRRAGERGVATVWAVAWLTVLLTVGWLALVAAAAAAAQHHLDASADLAALSGAQAVQSGRDGCDAAAHVARRNDVRLDACSRLGPDVVVTVTDEVGLPLDIDGSISSTARAGP